MQHMSNLDVRTKNKNQLSIFNTIFLSLTCTACLFFVFFGFFVDNRIAKSSTTLPLGSFKTKNLTKTYNKFNDSDHIHKLLKKVGIDVSDDVIDKLPQWSSIGKLYGTRQRFVGLDTCQEFRSTYFNSQAWIAPAGMFNTGTNLLANLLLHNCYMPDRRKNETDHESGMFWQVPWGKHSPVTLRGQNIAKYGGKGKEQTKFLPIVIIKDPYTWMASMCRNKYTAKWEVADHCPNLVSDDGKKPVSIRIKYSKNNIPNHTSMVTFWNDWYEGYMNATFPRLIVRYEDILFQQAETTRIICECGGGRIHKGPFKYYVKPSKELGNGLLEAITKYGNENDRRAGYLDRDLAYARKELNPSIMEKFHYKHINES